MQSVDEFVPSTTEPVFGSGLIQNKVTPPSIDEAGDQNDQVKKPESTEPIVNDQNESENSKPNSTQPTNEVPATVALAVNGDDVKAAPAEETTEKPAEVEPEKPTEEVSSSVAEPVPEAKEEKKSDETPAEVVEPAEVETEATATATAEVEPAAPKGRTPRGKAKAAAASTTPRQSGRGRKATSSGSVINNDDNHEKDDTSNSNNNATTTMNSSETPTRAKRQAATIAQDAITASHQPNSTSGSSIADDGNDQDAIPSDLDDDDEVVGSKTKKGSPAGRKGAAGRKRAASSRSAGRSPKKSKSKGSVTSTDDGDSADDYAQSPPRKARASTTKKTPEVSDEYVRKLRPRK